MSAVRGLTDIAVPPSRRAVTPTKMNAARKSNQRILCDRSKGRRLRGKRDGSGIRRHWAGWSDDNTFAFESHANAPGCLDFNTKLRLWCRTGDLLQSISNCGG
jgi:hypothetical protein